VTARAGHVAVLVATALAMLLLGAAPNGTMASLIGRDRVSANYPGFRPNIGDTATLAAMRVPGTPLHGTEGMSDSIEIRFVETLSPRRSRAFNGADAIAAANHVRNEQTLSVGPVERLLICGRPGFGFTTVGRYNGPYADDTQVFDSHERWLTAHAVINVDGDVWQAEYQQPRSGQSAIAGAQMIAFAAHFCIQRHYRSAANVPH